MENQASMMEGGGIPEEGVTNCRTAGATWPSCLKIKWSVTGRHSATELAAKVVSVAFGSARGYRVKFCSTVIGDNGDSALASSFFPYC